MAAWGSGVLQTPYSVSVVVAVRPAVVTVTSSISFRTLRKQDATTG